MAWRKKTWLWVTIGAWLWLVLMQWAGPFNAIAAGDRAYQNPENSEPSARGSPLQANAPISTASPCPLPPSAIVLPERPSKIIRVGVPRRHSQQPLLYKNLQGEWKGFAIEVTQAAIQAIGSDVQFVEVDENTDFRLRLKSGEVDVWPMWFSDTADADEDVLLGLPYLNMVPCAWVYSSVPRRVRLQDLSALRAGVVNNSASARWFAELGLGKPEVVESRIAGLRRLEAGQIDVLIGSHATISAMAQNLNMRSQLSFSLLGSREPSGKMTFAVAKDRSDLLFWLNSGLVIVGSSGRYHDLYVRHLADPSPEGRAAEKHELAYARPLADSLDLDLRPLRMAMYPRTEAYRFIYSPLDSASTRTYEGLAVDLAKELQTRLNRPVEIEHMQEHEVLAAMELGRIDGVLLGSLSDHPSLLVDFSQPVLKLPLALYMRAGTKAPTSIDELKDLSVAVTWASRGHGYLTNIQHERIRPMGIWNSTFDALLAGEVDAVLASATHTSVLAKLPGLTPELAQSIRKVPVPGPTPMEYQAVAVRANNPALLWSVNAAISGMERDGTLDRLYDRWVGSMLPRPMDSRQWRVVYWVAGSIAGVSALAGLWVLALRRQVKREATAKLDVESAVRAITDALPIVVYSYEVHNGGQRIPRYVSNTYASYEVVFPTFRLDKPYEETILPILHPDDVAEYVAKAKHSRATGEKFDFQYRLRDYSGTYRWIHSIVTSSPIANGRMWSALMLETTAAQRSIERVTQSQKSFEALVESAPHTAIQFYDNQARVVRWNSASTAIYGWTEAEALGKPIGSLMVDAKGQQDFLDEIAQLDAGFPPSPPAEMAIHTKSGAQAMILSSLSKLTQPDGTSVYVCVDVDITPIKQALAQQAALESQLARGAKLESMGVMAGGVAHDLNNMLTSIIGHGSLAIDLASKPEQARKEIEQAIQSARRAESLTAQLLIYAGQQVGQWSKVSIPSLIDDSRPFFRFSLPESVEMFVNLEPNLPTIDADPTQVQQLLMNLMINAGEAMEGRAGKVHVSARVRQLSANELSRCLLDHTKAAGSFIELLVEDSGFGMEQATLEHIFEPFFSTKFTGRGLGLAVVVGVIRAHHGALHVTSKPGVGTKFFAYFPLQLQNPGASVGPLRKPPQMPKLAADALSVPPFAPQGKSPLVSSATHVDPAVKNGSSGPSQIAVLVVDDEPLVRNATAAMLTSLGCKVVTREDGESALEVIRDHAQLFELVLLDQTMPGMTGGETIAAVRKLNIDIPIILTSGYSAQRIRAASPSNTETPLDQANVFFLAKPYDRWQLAQVISSVLGRHLDLAPANEE